MTTLVQKLETAAKKFGSIACFGMDPVPARFPPGLTMNGVTIFYTSIVAEMGRQKVWPGAVKPNEGFYSKHDRQDGHPTFHCSKQLEQVIMGARLCELPVIFDAKRGDIGPSSQNYADETKDVWGADAITVSPYLGTDSVEPFIKTGAAYVLCRTSNPGGKELQNLYTLGEQTVNDCANALERLMRLKDRPFTANDAADIVSVHAHLMAAQPLYLRVAQKIIDWDAINPGNIGAVVGATNIAELKSIAKYFVNSGKRIPLLIPGVGKQGGNAREVVTTLKEVGYDLSIARINSSSDLNFAWEKEGKPEEYAAASVRALKRLNDEIAYTP